MPGPDAVIHAEPLKYARKSCPAGAVANEKVAAGKPLIVDADVAVSCTKTSGTFPVADGVNVPSVVRAVDCSAIMPFGGVAISTALTAPVPATVTRLETPAAPDAARTAPELESGAADGADGGRTADAVLLPCPHAATPMVINTKRAARRFCITGILRGAKANGGVTEVRRAILFVFVSPIICSTV